MHGGSSELMVLTLTIGDRIINLIFKDGSEKILPFFRSVYRDFIRDSQKSGVNVEVRFLSNTGKSLFGISEDEENYREFALKSDRLNHWVGKYNKHTDDLPVTRQTIGVQSSTGRLLYSPETTEGRIYLPEKDRHPYRSLYRLFWIYFAQILGETGGCFLHAASIAKEGTGVLLIGGSGTGKSTLARLVHNVDVLADEAPVIFNGGGNTLRACPSPYHQLNAKHCFRKSLVTSGTVIKGISFIIQDEKTFIEPVSITDAIAMIMARYIHFFSFVSPNAKAKIFDLLHRACHKLPINCLHFVKNTDVWETIRLSYS